MILVARKLTIISVSLALLLTSCRLGQASQTPTQGTNASIPQSIQSPFPSGNGGLPAAPPVPVPTGILSTSTSQGSFTPESTLLSPLPTSTSTPTPTSTTTPTLTATPTPHIELNLLIISCDTSFDLFNRLGEVTNAYIRMQNIGQAGVDGINVTMQASDEDKPHPDKAYKIDHLPPGYEIALKLTVDTKNGQNTSIQVTAENDQGTSVTVNKDSCRSRRPDRDALQKLGQLFKIRPVSTPYP